MVNVSYDTVRHDIVGKSRMMTTVFFILTLQGQWKLHSVCVYYRSVMRVQESDNK